MPTMQFRTTISRSRETVFRLITDLASYKTWLPASELFSEVLAISSGPVGRGITYLDRGPTTTLQGKITDFSPPARVVFQENAQFQRFVFHGTLDILIRYTLEPVADGTQVTRRLSVQSRGVVTLLQPILFKRIKKENERILSAMKTYLEAR